MKFAFLCYPGVEPIDLAALGVVSMARRVLPELLCTTVAATRDLQLFSSGLRVAPEHDFASCPEVDALIVPGGPGWVEASADAALLAFLRGRAPRATIVSICTGAMIVAAAGLLDGRSATTKREVVPPEESPLGLLGLRHPQVDAVPALLVDSGDIVTGGGVSLCIDTILYVLRTRLGEAGKIDEVARILEYGFAAEANRQRLPILMRSAAQSDGTNI